VHRFTGCDTGIVEMSDFFRGRRQLLHRDGAARLPGMDLFDYIGRIHHGRASVAASSARSRTPSITCTPKALVVHRDIKTRTSSSTEKTNTSSRFQQHRIAEMGLLMSAAALVRSLAPLRPSPSSPSLHQQLTKAPAPRSSRVTRTAAEQDAMWALGILQHDRVQGTATAST